MPFAARILVPTTNPPGYRLPAPGKIYIHSGGLEAVFGSIDVAARYALKCLHDWRPVITETQPAYFIAAPWGTGGKMMLDLVLAKGITDDTWASNPAFATEVLEDGLWVRGSEACARGNHPHPTFIERGCGDFFIMLGAEERHRRTTGNLEEFLRSSPHLLDLEPPITKTIE